MIAIIEKYPTSVDYAKMFEFEFELFSLVEAKQTKVLVKDVTLDIDYDEYELIILVGAEPLKMIGKRSGITELQGTLFNEKYVALANPSMIAFKPEAKPGIEKAIIDINNIVNQEIKEPIWVDSKGLQNSTEILEELRKCYIEGETHIAVDTETTSLYPRDGYIIGISITWKPYQGIYIDCDYITEEIEIALQTLFDKYICIFHNNKFDIKMLKYHFGFTFPKVEDTLVLHYALDERQGFHGLKQLALKFTEFGDYERGLVDFKTEYCRHNKVKKADFTYDLIPFEIMWPYACLDTVIPYELFFGFMDHISKDKILYNLYYNILLPGTSFLLEMEENGVPFSTKKLHEAQLKLDNDIFELHSRLYEFKEVAILESNQEAKFNPNSTAQLRVLFFDMLGLKPLKKTDTGAWSTDAETLEYLSKRHELPALISELRKTKKIKSTYIDKILLGLDSDNRLRTNFNLTTTTSGRLSSSGKLNMQQLPRDNKIVKDCIVASDGFSIISGDLGTAEMVVAAALSGDRVLQDMFIRGDDYHGFMAVNKFNLPCTANEVATLFPDKRQEAKTVSFEILYKLNLREPVLDKFPTLKNWLIKTIKDIETNGCIYSHFGRKRRLRNIRSSDRQIVSHEIRSGVNFVVQSTASDITLLAAIELNDWIKHEKLTDKIKIFALVHDSILAEVHDSVQGIYIDKLRECLQRDRGLNFRGFKIKVDVEIGSTYAFIKEKVV